MRYINKQIHNASCGPVAIMNALKWLGNKGVSYRKFFPMLTVFGYCSYSGIPNKKNIGKYLKLFKVKYRPKYYPTIQDIERELDRGNGILLNYAWFNKDDSSGHYVFIDEHTNIKFHALNYAITSKGKAKCWLSKRKLGKWFRSSKRWNQDRPQMWIIRNK